MHMDEQIMMGPGTLLTRLRLNGTYSTSVTLAGSLEKDGDCDGAQYSDQYTTYKNVVVEASITISLSSHFAKIDRGKNTIHLRSGIVCSLNKDECIDNLGGHTFWTNARVEHCNLRDKYDVLYDGLSTKTTSDKKKDDNPSYTVKTNSSTFSLMGKGEMPVCGYKLIHTVHPRLFLMETSYEQLTNFGPVTPLVENVDLILLT